MYEIVISNYEEHEKELLQENSYLRQLLLDFHESILHKSKSILVSNADTFELETEVVVVDQMVHANVFQLPFQMMRDSVLEATEKSLDQLCKCCSFNIQTTEQLMENLKTKIG